MNLEQVSSSQNINNKGKEEVPVDFEWEQLINECLATRELGFKEEISVNILGKVFMRAPQGETFTVPDERKKQTYEYIAKVMGRNDLKFVIRLNS